AALLQQLDQLERRRLAIVVDVGFVREAEDEDARAEDALAVAVDRLHDPVDDVARHRRVHFAGELDEARPRAELRGAPGEIKRIERNAVTAEARAGIKGHEAE